MGKRRASLLLLPILAFIFLIGWIMYSAGQSKPSKKALQKSPKQPSKDLLAAEKDVEMGVVTELAQEQEISQE